MDKMHNDRNPDSLRLKDTQDLEKFGYSQQLNRSMGAFSSFAISFSLISVLTGIYANFNFGYLQIGGYIVWSWLLVGLGQFMVALVMADLSASMPISGYGYQWSARLVHADYGYFVGWLLLIQFITGFPGTCQALAVTLSGIMGGESSGNLVTYISLIVVSSVTIIHLIGIRAVTLVNNMGAYAELAGIAFLLVLLCGIWVIAGQVSSENLFAAGNALSKNGNRYASFALSLLLGAWCLTGFEAAADLAEETHSPRKNVPHAVILSQISAALAGFFILVFLVLSVKNIPEAQNSSNSLLFILEHAIGTRLTTFIGIIVMLSIYACAVASLATATRLIFSLSRDNILPFSEYLSRVNKKNKTPQFATVVVWVLSCLAIITLRRIEIITSVGAIAAYCGYLGIMLAALLDKKETVQNEGFSLGKWKRPVQVLSLIWTLIVVAALTIPNTPIEGIASMHIPALSTLAVIIAGILIYIFSVRKKIKNGKAGPPKI